MSAVSGMDELALPARLQALLLHQASHSVAAHTQALGLQTRAQPATAVVATAGLEDGLQRCGEGAGPRGSPTAAYGIHARATHAHKPAQPGGFDLLLPLIDHLLDHFSSLAKKADAFFKIDTSSRSRWFSRSNSRMRCCSAVNGLPWPG
ncbi:hypothetical protein D3C84_665250 [compost metagenome]